MYDDSLKKKHKILWIRIFIVCFRCKYHFQNIVSEIRFSTGKQLATLDVKELGKKSGE